MLLMMLKSMNFRFNFKVDYIFTYPMTFQHIHVLPLRRLLDRDPPLRDRG